MKLIFVLIFILSSADSYNLIAKGYFGPRMAISLIYFQKIGNADSEISFFENCVSVDKTIQHES